MMTTPNVGELETTALERSHHVPATDSGQGHHAVATSLSTSSSSGAPTVTVMPSMAAASMYPMIASRVFSTASSRVAPKVDKNSSAGTYVTQTCSSASHSSSTLNRRVVITA